MKCILTLTAELTDQTRRLLLQLLERALATDTATATTATHHPPSQWFGNNDRTDALMLTTNTMDSSSFGDQLGAASNIAAAHSSRGIAKGKFSILFFNNRYHDKIIVLMKYSI